MDGSAIVRAYISTFVLGVYPGWTADSLDNPLVATAVFAPGVSQTLHIKIRDNVWAWSSNVYTFDYVVERAWNTFSFMPGEFDTPGYAFATSQIGAAPCPRIVVHAGSPSLFFIAPTPAAPSTYWRKMPTNCLDP